MPIVVAWRTGVGSLHSGIGAGVMVNEDGWFLTASHILEQINQLHEAVRAPVPAKLSRRQRRNQITNFVVIVGATKARVTRAVAKPGVDIGAGKLDGFEPPPEYEYPRLRTREVEQGELLCRLGFPFAQGVDPSWNSEKEEFIFANLFPVPLFVNEGVVSRFVTLGEGYRWIETSSPGLMGQSGGPLVDPEGLVCGIQVNTEHYELGFKGKAKNQVLNVGRAVDVKAARALLDEHEIAYRTEGD